MTAAKRPQLKGDTIEFNVEQVRMRRNAVVQDLLRRLPGLRIEIDGTITYNGEKIEHLLVGGEDIFQGGPGLVAQNFDADKIARVQILDRRSDRSRFSGVDDGTRIKTINLVLKESAKNGYSGRTEISSSAEGNYTAGGVVAGFRRKEQFAAIALSGNTGVINFEGGGETQATYSFTSDIGDPIGASAGTGIPRFSGASLHYSNQWDDCSHLMTNYQFGNLWTNPITKTEMVQVLSTGIYSQQQKSQSINKEEQQSGEVVFERNISPRSALQMSLQSLFGRSRNQLQAVSETRLNDTLLNSSLRNVIDQVNTDGIGGNLSWRLELGRLKSRILSFSARISKDDNKASGYIYSMNRFLERGTVNTNLDTLDQRKVVAAHNFSDQFELTYTQPVFHVIDLGFIYELTDGYSNPIQASYNRAGGKYTQLVDSLTNDLKVHTLSQQADISIQGKLKGLKYSVGTSWLYHYSAQKLRGEGSVLPLRNFYVVPRVLIDYLIRKALDMRINYEARTLQPSVSELASLKNNNDPLRLTIGNPNLRPSINQSLIVNFRLLRPWMVYTAFVFGFNSNSISTKTVTDSSGRQVSQPVNVKGGRTLGANLFINHAMGGIEWGFRSTNSYNRSINYVDATLNRSTVISASGGVSATKYVSNKYSIQLNADIKYLDSRNSVNASVTMHYWTQSHGASVRLFVIPHYEIGSSATVIWQERANEFSSNTSTVLWNAYLSRNLLHDDLRIKFLVNNVLDQNAGITRINKGNTNTQTASNILGRYWMLSVMYHFEKKLNKK